MTKNASTAPWTQTATTIPGWVVDPTYPGSALVGDKLAVQGTKTNATISATVQFSGSNAFTEHRIQLVDQNNNPIGAAGQPITAGSGTCTVSATGVNLTGITSVGVQTIANGPNGGTVTASTPALSIT
ncbi:hypothetical protein [Nocardia sp. IFM 10818]